jgi:hypothetical protein
MTDGCDAEFIDRFWIAYWQGRLLVQQAFGSDGDVDAVGG